MEKMLYLLVRWPLIEAAVVFVLLTQVPFGAPWYVTAWFVLGASMLAMVVTQKEKSRLEQRFARVPAAPVIKPLLP